MVKTGRTNLQSERTQEIASFPRAVIVNSTQTITSGIWTLTGRWGIFRPPPRQGGCGWTRSRAARRRRCMADAGHGDGPDPLLLTPGAAPGHIICQYSVSIRGCQYSLPGCCICWTLRCCPAWSHTPSCSAVRPLTTSDHRQT